MRDGPRGFTPDFSCPALLRCRLGCQHRFRVRGFHPLRPQFPLCSPSLPMCLRWRSYNPGGRRNGAGLGCCAFARHYLRNHCCFLLLRVLRCFSSPGSPPRPARMPESLPAGCPIRKSAARRVFAPRRGLSQLVTSFFASGSLGILHVPFSPFLFLSRKVAFIYSFFRLDLILPHPPYRERGSVALEIYLCSGPLLRRPAFCLICSCYLCLGLIPLPPLRAAGPGPASFHHVNVLCLRVVPGRVELPTSTLSV